MSTQKEKKLWVMKNKIRAPSRESWSSLDIISFCGSIPIEILILWPRAVMVCPRPRVLLTPPLRDQISPMSLGLHFMKPSSPFCNWPAWMKMPSVSSSLPMCGFRVQLSHPTTQIHSNADWCCQYRLPTPYWVWLWTTRHKSKTCPRTSYVSGFICEVSLHPTTVVWS
jgi:hypothetical protein